MAHISNVKYGSKSQNENQQETSIPTRSKKRFTENRKKCWNEIDQIGMPSFLSKSYHRIVEKIYKNIIPKGARVLEIGCFHGDLIKSLEPEVGVGIDFSEKIIHQARKKYPEYEFIAMDAHDLESLDGEFDYIILSDLVNDVFDIQEVLEKVKSICTSQTRVVVNFYSHLWSLPINVARNFGVARKILLQSWVTGDDFKNILTLTGFNVVSDWKEILFPLNVPLVAGIFNRFLAKIWPFSLLALSSFFVIRTSPDSDSKQQEASVSIIVAARNEAGHITEILERTPLIGSQTELIFVEGGSSDSTFETIENELKTYNKMPAFLYRQPGKGKGDAVRLGFEKAQNDILMILDADLTVMPENLPKFYQSLKGGKGEFINGVRLVYPMEKSAMRFLNLVGNKFFSLGFSYVLNQPVKDTLCGTKVLYRRDYETIAKHRDYFGEFDPYGDFDLIFGAARQNLKIVDMPIRYQARVYGETNINRWQGGLLLLRMLVIALKKLKFI